jgi:hypothetical protein
MCEHLIRDLAARIRIAAAMAVVDDVAVVLVIGIASGNNDRLGPPPRAKLLPGENVRKFTDCNPVVFAPRSNPSSLTLP